MWLLLFFYTFVEVFKNFQHLSMSPYTMDCGWPSQTNSKLELILKINHLEIFWVILQDNFTKIQPYLSDSVFLFLFQNFLQLLQPSYGFLIRFLTLCIAHLHMFLLLDLLLLVYKIRMDSKSRDNKILIFLKHGEQRAELISSCRINNDVLYIMMFCIFNNLVCVLDGWIIQQMCMCVHEGALLNDMLRFLQLHGRVNRLNQIIITFILMMQSGNLNSVDISERQSNDTMKKANTFLSELHQIPSKYTQQERDEFITEFNQLNDHERYTCAEVILSNAWGHINSNRLAKARADLGLIIPLCVQKDQKQLDFPEFEVDRMVYQSWSNDKDFPEEKRDAYNKLMEQCGFQFQRYKQPIVRKKQKSGFRSFLDILTCKCCAKTGA